MSRLLAFIIALAPMGALADCRQALALGLDVSGSVDAAEYRLQLDGLAGALTHPTVVAAFLSIPQTHVELMVYEWSGPQVQRMIVSWSEVRSAASLEQTAQQLRQTQRHSDDPSTAIGSSMLFGAVALQSRAHCDRKVLDVSGDGPANTGPVPQSVQRSAVLAGITINGLVIPSLDQVEGDRRTGAPLALDEYYRAYVIRGPEAFTEMALGFQDYEDAMKRKLIRELRGMVLSLADTSVPQIQ